MSQVSQPETANEPRWWLSNQGTPAGPYSEGFILAGLKTGTIAPQTYACPVGGQVWKRLSELPVFCSASPTTGLPPPPPPPPRNRSQSVPAPWNPRTIAWLGLAFSPLWAGIMTAINGRRLRTAVPAWQPVAIGAGATLLDILISLMFVDSMIVDLILYLGAIGLIWFVHLDRQTAEYERRRGEAGRQASWVVPAIAGSPAALVVFLTFVVSPLMPLGPLQVCQRFVDASTLAEAKKYTTTKLWPALAAIDSSTKNGSQKVSVGDRCDWTGEADNPGGLGGHGVGYRMYWEESGSPHVMEGFFHLVDSDGRWKIEEWYFTSFDQQEAAIPVALSSNYRDVFGSASQSSPTRSESTSAVAGEEPSSETSKGKNPFGTFTHHPFFRYVAWGYEKGGIFGAIAAFIVIAVIIKSFTATTNSKPS